MTRGSPRVRVGVLLAQGPVRGWVADVVHDCGMRVSFEVDDLDAAIEQVRGENADMLLFEAAGEQAARVATQAQMLAVESGIPITLVIDDSLDDAERERLRKLRIVTVGAAHLAKRDDQILSHLRSQLRMQASRIGQIRRTMSTTDLHSVLGTLRQTLPRTTAADVPAAVRDPLDVIVMAVGAGGEFAAVTALSQAPTLPVPVVAVGEDADSLGRMLLQRGRHAPGPLDGRTPLGRLSGIRFLPDGMGATFSEGRVAASELVEGESDVAATLTSLASLRDGALVLLVSPVPAEWEEATVDLDPARVFTVVERGTAEAGQLTILEVSQTLAQALPRRL